MGGEVSSGPVGVRQCNCTYGGGYSPRVAGACGGPACSVPTAVHAQREASCHHHRKRADWPANCRGSCSSVGHAVHAQDSPVTCRDVRTNAAQQVLRGTHRRHARRVLAGAREAPAGGCSSSGRGSDGKCTLLINRSVVTSPSSLRTSTSAQIAQTAERQLCSRRGLTGDADAAARTAPVGRDGMCTPASRLGPQGGSGRGEQANVRFFAVLSYPECAKLIWELGSDRPMGAPTPTT